MFCGRPALPRPAPSPAASSPRLPSTLHICPWVPGRHLEAGTPMSSLLLFLSKSPHCRAFLTLAQHPQLLGPQAAPGLRHALFCPRPILSIGTSHPCDCQRHSPGSSHLDKGSGLTGLPASSLAPLQGILHTEATVIQARSAFLLKPFGVFPSHLEQGPGL